MATKYLSRKEEKEIRKEIAAYNRRAYDISRQKRFKGVYTPQKLDIKLEINAIENKRDLNRLRNLMANAFKPENLRVVSNKKGVKATAGVLRQIRLDIEAANRRLTRSIKELESRPVYVAGHYQGTAAEINPEIVQERRPIKFDFGGTPTTSQLQFKQERARKNATASGLREQNENYLKNYITAISNRLPAQWADILIGQLDTLTGDEFFDMMLTFPEIEMDYIYSLEEAIEKAIKISNIISQYVKG